MNITLMAFGSRGDIQPFLALAVALRERGHQVALAAPLDSEAQIKAYGIPFIPIPFHAKELDVSNRMAREGITLGNTLAFLREVIPASKRALLSGTYEIAAAAQNADLLIAHGFFMPFAYSLHQRLQIPLMLGIAAPIVPTHQFPSPMFPPIPFGQRLYNPLTYDWLVRFVISFMIEPMNTYRKDVGLPTLSAGKVIRAMFSGEFPVVMHYSRHLVPVPLDWGAHVHVVGAWTLPALPDWKPLDALTAFLAQGEPPVYFGFGSNPVANVEQMTQTIKEALRLANVRGVLQLASDHESYQDEQLITIGDAPHDWLFPRMAAAVHHGGSGTTHSALSAGLPALIVPYMADQPMWGQRLVELGVGVPPIRAKHLTPARLADALRTLTQDSTMRQRAAEMGVLLHAENGLAATCELAEGYGT